MVDDEICYDVRASGVFANGCETCITNIVRTIICIIAILACSWRVLLIRLDAINIGGTLMSMFWCSGRLLYPLLSVVLKSSRN